MWKLRNEIATAKENDFALATNDFFRPDLKQIGNSVFEIKKYFNAEGLQTVTPSKFEGSLAEVNDCLLGLVENHAFFLGQNPKPDRGRDKNYPVTESCFMFLSETLSFALDFATSPRPNNVVCDVFIAFPSMPTMVLSIVGGDEDSEEALVYNTSVARGVREKLVRFMDEDVNSIHGVINISTLKDSISFNTRLKVLANDSFHFVPKYTLFMNVRRHDKVLSAFWAGVAETKSVLRDTVEADDDSVRFLTKEQCIILVENTNSKEVEVKCMPGSGATTLMLEVARRLNRLGDTLLVCRSRQERDRLRCVCPSVVSANDLNSLDLSSYVNIVDETNSVPPETRCRRWKFTRYLTDMKHLQDTKWMLEKEIDKMDKFLDVFAKDTWRQRMKYLLGDFDVLILLFEKIKRDAVFHQTENSPQTKPHYPHAGSFSFKNIHTMVRETELISWQERVEQGKNVFPLLRSIVAKDKTSLIYQDVKMTFLERASRGEDKRQESTQKYRNLLNTIGASTDMPIGAEDGGKQQSIDAVDGQDTHDVGENTTDGVIAERDMQDIESLNEELDSLISNRDHRRRRLDRLQTNCWTLVEWQNSVDYLMRYPKVLSLFNVELPGMDSVSSSQDQDEGNLPRRTKHRQSSKFTKESKQNLSDGTSKLVEVKREDEHSAEGGCHSTSGHKGLIHQLRKYQLGSLKESDLTTFTLKVMAENEQQLTRLVAKNASLEKGFGSIVHIVGLECRPLPISCPRLHLDAARANTRFCHVTEDGLLVNRRPDTRDEGQNRLQEYEGTCSSPTPLPPSSSTITPLPTTPRYWETETRVRVGDRPFPPSLEVGVCEAGQVDSSMFVSLQRRSWCVSVGRCDRHGESVCTTVWREREQGECHQNTMSRTPGTKATLHYGVVLDVGRGRVAFIDIDRQVVLGKCNVEFREPLVPMFSAGLPFSFLTTSMSLISGADIDMTDTKKALIYQALK